MTYYLGNSSGERVNKRSFKTFAGVKRARRDMLDEGSGVKLCRESTDKIEVYCGSYQGKEGWITVQEVSE